MVGCNFRFQIQKTAKALDSDGRYIPTLRTDIRTRRTSSSQIIKLLNESRRFSVKQEIFMTDVTNCVSSLRKVVQELQSVDLKSDLQMAQPTVRSSALTLSVDPKKSAVIMDFDAFVADWNDYLDIDKASVNQSNLDFDPSNSWSKKTKHKKPPSMMETEDVRADNCTLKEHHDHLLSGSFDLSFIGSGGYDPSSSQVDPAFSLDDTLFPPGEEIDMGGGLGEELARELGEGWGGSLQKIVTVNATGENEDHPMDIDFNFDVPGSPLPCSDLHQLNNEFVISDTPSRHSRKRKVASKENQLPRSPSLALPVQSPTNSLSRLLLSPDIEPAALRDVTPINQVPAKNKTKKFKRTRLLLDARTELTDEELKIARAEYNRRQEALRSELNQKKVEKDTEKYIEDIIWGVPKSIQAPDLVDFWQENFKVQVEARTGLVYIHPSDEPPTKRRKVRDMSDNRPQVSTEPDTAINMINDMPYDVDVPIFEDVHVFNDHDLEPSHFRSSEEPGQGRQNSRPPSVLSKTNFGLDFVSQDLLGSSQKSSLFPWDHAAAESSSSGFAGQPGSDQIAIDRADTLMRGSSLSGRESPSVHGHTGSVMGLSPANFARSSDPIGEDYEFEVGPLNQATQSESQVSDNLITLERNSFNFLEYTKMQQNTLPNSFASLSFDIIVPSVTSTRHVAAAAFYHCLVLATKDILRLKQSEPYGPLSIVVIA